MANNGLPSEARGVATSEGWRWRELNPHPKSFLKQIYKLGLFIFGLFE